jgi:hypothetical protein
LFSSRRCGNKGQDTRCWKKYGRRVFVSSYCGKTLQAPSFPSPGLMPGPQQGLLNIGSYHLQIISKYITSVYEDGIMKSTESCGVIGERGIEKERVIEGVNLINIQYIHG